MAETAYPFDAGPGANVTEDQWAGMARQWSPDAAERGVDDGCQVVLSGGMKSSLGVGNVSVRGFRYRNDAAKEWTHAAVATAGRGRWDTWAIKLDRTANTITAVVVVGAEAVNPVPPVLTQDDLSGVWMVPWADVYCENGSNIPLAISDRRNFYGANDSLHAYADALRSSSNDIDNFPAGSMAALVRRKITRAPRGAYLCYATLPARAQSSTQLYFRVTAASIGSGTVNNLSADVATDVNTDFRLLTFLGRHDHPGDMDLEITLSAQVAAGFGYVKTGGCRIGFLLAGPQLTDK